jgi:CHAD domain-containing protein
MLPESFEGDEKGEWGRMLRDAAEARRRAADAVCTREVTSASFTGLVLGLAAWMETGRDDMALLGRAALECKLRRVAPDLLDCLIRKICERGRAVKPAASPGELHPLRKSLKKLSYDIEFVGSLYPKKR